MNHEFDLRRRRLIMTSLTCGLVMAGVTVMVGASPASIVGAAADDLPARMQRLLKALHLAGEPLAPAEAQRVLELSQHYSDRSFAELADILNKRTLATVKVDQHGVGVAARGGAALELVESGWRTFLLRVENPFGLTGPLLLVNPTSIANPYAILEGEIESSIHESHILGNDLPADLNSVPDVGFDFGSNPAQWIGYSFGTGSLPQQSLTGVPLEYLVLLIYSQRRGTNSAFLAACTSALPFIRRPECKGFAAEFACSPASRVTLEIGDAQGRGLTAALQIYDSAGRLYPAPAHRLEPDLGYQPQIYRADGEVISLPAGQYKVFASRGPEYLQYAGDLSVPSGGAAQSLSVVLQRWIDPRNVGWYSGDPHLHAEGQAYGFVSRLGLTPETLLRQTRGEALTVGSVLIWAGGYYYERQFLTGRAYEPTWQLPFPEVQRANGTVLIPARSPRDTDSILRYDVEQAAFPSNRLGHPVLLCVRNHEYPGVKSIYDWPSWNLPVFRWARAQGAVGGYAHAGHSMAVNSTELPNYEIPTLDGLGANEGLVDVTHGLIDFLAGGENHPVTDLNVWYNLLNCGFLIPMIGETDFPVGARTRRVGVVRTYVGLESAPHGNEGYEAWVAGVKTGRLYFGDGRSHLIDFNANGHGVGMGSLSLSRPSKVILSARVAAWLDEQPRDPYSDPHTVGYSFWHLEHARVGTTRKVPLEVIVNGVVVERTEVAADGILRTMHFTIDVLQSSWVALRILPSAHTASIGLLVGGKPIRASRRSAEWCLQCVEVLWRKHAMYIRESERPDAAAAWDHAREVYRKIIAESTLA